MRAAAWLLPLAAAGTAQAMPASSTSGCNPERDALAVESRVDDAGRPITRDPGFPKPPTKKILLPQDDGSAALDGSPMAVYFSPSSSGSTCASPPTHTRPTDPERRLFIVPPATSPAFPSAARAEQQVDDLD